MYKSPLPAIMDIISPNNINIVIVAFDLKRGIAMTIHRDH